MTALGLAILATAIGMVAVFVYAKQKGGIEKKNLNHWWFAVVILMFMVLLAFAGNVKASELEFSWADYTEAYIGVDWQLRRENPQCVGGGTDDRLLSHGGLTQHIVGFEEFDLEFVYTHNSCAINDDRFVSDTIGGRIVYRKEW